MRYHFDVKTTTFLNRNVKTLAVAEKQVQAQNPEGLRILQVGPGMAVRGVGRYNHVGRFQIVKRLETVLRRLPLPIWCYENFETREILDVFKDRNPLLTVADISQKSLNVIEQNFKGEIAGTVQIDLAKDMVHGGSSTLGDFDLVICFASVRRVPKPMQMQALKNIIACTRPGGLLLVDEDVSDMGMKPETEDGYVFRRTAP